MERLGCLPRAGGKLLALTVVVALILRYANVFLTPFQKPYTTIEPDSGIVDRVVAPGSPVPLLARASYTWQDQSIVSYHSRLGFPFRRFSWTVVPSDSYDCVELAQQLGDSIHPGRARVDKHHYLIADAPGCVEVQARGYGVVATSSYLVLGTTVQLDVTPRQIESANAATFEFDLHVAFGDGRRPPTWHVPSDGMPAFNPIEPRLQGNAVSALGECDQIASGTLISCRVDSSHWHVKALAYGVAGKTQPALITYLGARVPISIRIKQ